MKNILIMIKPFKTPFFIALFTFILCILSPYYISGTDIPNNTIFSHILYVKKADFLESFLFSFPYIGKAISGNRWFIILLPLLSASPYLFRFSSELETKFFRFALIRMSYAQYWVSSFMKNGFFGSFTVMLGYFMYIVVVIINFPSPNEYPNEMMIPLNSYLNRIFETDNALLFLLSQALILFVFVFIVSEICLILYLILHNRYKAIGLPMIVFYLLDQVSISLFRVNNWDTRYDIISPVNLVFYTENSFSSFGMDIYWYYLFAALTISGLFVIGYILCKRRYSE